MEKVYQVFVSSTFSDLESERKKVSDTLAKAGFIPSGMELFPATSLKQLEFIKKVIDRCDYYVVIVGGRYGSLEGDKSYTEHEYEYALTKNIPVLAFLHKNPGKIASEHTEADPKQVARLEAFRSRLKASRIVYHWTDINDLCTNVLVAVTSEVTLSPGVGWVRGDQAIEPKFLQELERLRIRNADLEKQLNLPDELDTTFPSNLPAPDSEFEVRLYAGQNYLSPEQAQHKLRHATSWSEIFILSVDLILAEQDEKYIASAIAAELISKINAKLKPSKLDEEDFRQIKFQLEALGLIKVTVRHRQREGSSYAYIAWQITDKGRRYMSHKLALKSTEATTIAQEK
jgi:hypothetical protein